MQQKLIASMREELGMSKEQRAMAESTSERQATQLTDLKVRAADAASSKLSRPS